MLFRMKKTLLLILFPFSFSTAQNLVYNPSMEDTLTCSQWLAAGDWPLLNANGWIQFGGSSDYFNIDCTCGCVPLPFLLSAINLQEPEPEWVVFLDLVFL